MEIFVLTSCITGSRKFSPGCAVFLNEQTAKEAIGTGLENSIRECVEKYGVIPNNIEPQSNQGAMLLKCTTVHMPGR